MTDQASLHPVIIPAEMAGWRLDRALATLIPTFSRERIKVLISTGQFSLDGKILRDPAFKVKPESAGILEVPAPAPAHNVAQEIPLNIPFEDDHLLVVDKPAGLVVHPAAGNLDGTLVNALLHHCAGRLSGIGGVARPGIVHRIDKDTSGLLVVAKTDPAHEGLAAQFAKHSINRRYLAIVHGKPTRTQGRIESFLARSPHDRKKMAITPQGKGKNAITHWEVLEPLKDAALVECRLETGRTHQIRVHMSSIGHGLLGDPVYGSVSQKQRELLKEIGFQRQALHAASLGFIHPVTKDPLNFHSPTPSDMQLLLSRLRIKQEHV